MTVGIDDGAALGPVLGSSDGEELAEGESLGQ